MCQSTECPHVCPVAAKDKPKPGGRVQPSATASAAEGERRDEDQEDELTHTHSYGDSDKWGSNKSALNSRETEKLDTLDTLSEGLSEGAFDDLDVPPHHRLVTDSLSRPQSAAASDGHSSLHHDLRHRGAHLHQHRAGGLHAPKNDVRHLADVQTAFLPPAPVVEAAEQQASCEDDEEWVQVSAHIVMHVVYV